MRPTYSVIIPTYGRPAFLEEAIASVLAQTTDDLEIIVVDDASPEPVHLSPQHLQPINLVHAPANGGAAAARNLGVEHATGEVLTFLDDDDTWHPKRLEFAQQALERAPIAICWQSQRGRKLEGNVHAEILNETTPNLGAVAVERSVWMPLDASFRSCEDLLWWLEVTRRAHVATTAQQGLFVRRHAGARKGYGAEQRIADSYRLMAEQHAYFSSHPRAAAFRLRRIGLMQRSLGDRAAARKAHWQAICTHPNLRDVLHLARNFTPGARDPELS